MLDFFFVHSKKKEGGNRILCPCVSPLLFCPFLKPREIDLIDIKETEQIYTCPFSTFFFENRLRRQKNIERARYEHNTGIYTHTERTLLKKVKENVYFNLDTVSFGN